MASSTMSSVRQFEQDDEMWTNLKEAITTSSGFKRWQEEITGGETKELMNLEDQVCSYLRETLETLAY